MKRKSNFILLLATVLVVILGLFISLEKFDIINIVPNKYISIEPNNLVDYLPEIESLGNFGVDGCTIRNDILICGIRNIVDRTTDMLEIQKIENCTQLVESINLSNLGFSTLPDKYKNVLIYENKIANTQTFCVPINDRGVESITVTTNKTISEKYIDIYYKKKGWL